jgi:hypothetical protein
MSERDEILEEVRRSFENRKANTEYLNAVTGLIIQERNEKNRLQGLLQEISQLLPQISELCAKAIAR